MTMIPIRTFGDPVLKTPSADVESFDASLRSLVDDMFETMYGAPGVGLAASQVGLSLRLFVYDDGQGAKGALANPAIVEMTGELEEDEGCLSIPGVYHPTPRAAFVRIEGLDLGGKRVVLEGEELLARIFQHETDHLNGLLFIDRLGDEGRRRVLAELRDRELGAASARNRPSGSRRS